MNSEITLKNNRFEILTDGDEFVGIGKVWIDDTLVRSGKLPMVPTSQSFQGQELVSLKLKEIKSTTSSVRIVLDASFKRMLTKQMRDHSIDPIHDTSNWAANAPENVAQLELVLKPAKDKFNGVAFEGFSYHFAYKSKDTPLYWLMDRSTWEIGGNIKGVTAISQSAMSAPMVTFENDTTWSTEGVLEFLLEDKTENPVMTHNYPRWASHGSFDYQYKKNKTLIGVFEKVDLIRSIICRESGEKELKHFDKYIFDEAKSFKTVAKKILLNTDKKSEVDQKNVWTWIHEDVEERARQEYGLKQEPYLPHLSQNLWKGFNADSYFKDLIPAAEALGMPQIFVDNLKKSSETDKTPFPGKFNWNMCCGHEYEIAPEVGGNPKVKDLVKRAKEKGIIVKSWTNNDQALSSPYNSTERDNKSKYVLMDDTRQKYGGAYTNVFSILDFNSDEARNYFIDSHIKIKEETGLNWWLFDSFYNLGFMPVSYRDCAPKTMWKNLLKTFKKLQDNDVHFSIESFGPFGKPMHGHPSSYNLGTIFACYRVGVGNDYSTVPTNLPVKDVSPRNPEIVYYNLAHMAMGSMPVFLKGERIDKIWGEAHKQAIADYMKTLPYLKRRTLQEDNKSVWWADESGEIQTIFNFDSNEFALEGTVTDITTGKKLPKSDTYKLEAHHTYMIQPTKSKKG